MYNPHVAKNALRSADANYTTSGKLTAAAKMANMTGHDARGQLSATVVTGADGRSMAVKVAGGGGGRGTYTGGKSLEAPSNARTVLLSLHS